MLAASACKIWMRLAASCRQIVPEWPPVACKLYPRDSRPLSHSGTICMRLAATREQFLCDWPPVASIFSMRLAATRVQSCFWLAARRTLYLYHLRHCVWPHLVTPVNPVRYNLILTSIWVWVLWKYACICSSKSSTCTLKPGLLLWIQSIFSVLKGTERNRMKRQCQGLLKLFYYWNVMPFYTTPPALNMKDRPNVRS